MSSPKSLGLRQAAALIGFSVLAACSSGAGPAGGVSVVPQSAARAQSAPTPAPSVNVLPPPGTIYLGAFANASLQSPPLESDETTLESQIGRSLALSMHYYGFTDTFPSAAESADEAAGRMPVESWNCAAPDAAVAAGAEDAVIKQRAAAIRAFGRPIFLRYMWEMDAPSTASYRSACYDPATDEASGAFSPAEFIAAWSHIRSIFAAAGASNVVWLWNPTGSAGSSAYYPGASEVDWIGVDQYDPSETSVSGTFSASYASLSPFGKPMLIAETGVPSAHQSAFFGSVVATLQAHFPLVAGFMYFDSVGARDDWRIGGAGLGAFASMAHAAYLSAMPPS